MHNSNLAPGALVATSFLILSSAALARDRPGIPKSVSVKQESAGEVTLSLRNTAREERITFEYEMWVDGVRVDPSIETRVSQDSGGYLGKGTMYSIRVSREEHGILLGPDKEFCFRAWSRSSFEERTSYDRSDIRSDRPSGTACVMLKPDKPLPPKTVRAYFPNPSVTDRRVVVAWDMPAFEFNRPVDRFTVEREKWSGSTTYVVVATSDTPRIESSTSVSNFVKQIAPPTEEGNYLFKVCAHNSAGSECTHTSTSLVHKIPKIQGEAAPRPELAVAQPQRLNGRVKQADAPLPATTARATTATSQTTAGTETLVCRGGSLMGWANTPAYEGIPSQLSLIFQPTKTAPSANGDGLKPSECAIVGRAEWFSPNVRFDPGAVDVKQRLTSSNQYWSFKVRERPGYFEAVTHEAIGGPPVAIDPAQQIRGESTKPKPVLVPR